MESSVGKRVNVVKALDCGCRIASCAVLLFMVVLLIVSRSPFGEKLPAWLAAGSFLRKYLIPILCSAAVGYLTNAIAIWMLFKPYEPHRFWPQGVIPRQKASFGRELGILIPQYLLQPEKISAQIGKVALEYLQDSSFGERIRDYVKSFLARHSDKLAHVVVPYVQKVTAEAIRDNLTRETFDRLCRMVVHNFMTDPDTRAKTVQGAVALFRDLLPEFSGELETMIARRVAEAFRREHPVLNLLKEKFSSTTVEDEVREFWRRSEEDLLEELEEEETQAKIAEFFSRALQKGKAWTERPENAGKIEEFLLERREAAERYAADYLAAKIPALADELLSGDAFWVMLQEKALPALQLYVVRQLRGDGDSLLKKIDIPKKIEDAVGRMDMAQLHRFVVQASNDNLTVLQVLGFFLGGAAGVIMSFVL